jgi:hypothetical protein
MLAGIYTVIIYINSFDREDLTLVDSHTGKIYFWMKHRI